MERAKRGPYCHNRRPIFPSTARASSVSKLFIIWHSVLIVKCTSGGLHLKGFRRDVLVMTQAAQTKASYHEVEKQIY